MYWSHVAYPHDRAAPVTKYAVQYSTDPAFASDGPHERRHGLAPHRLAQLLEQPARVHVIAEPAILAPLTQQARHPLHAPPRPS